MFGAIVAMKATSVLRRVGMSISWKIELTPDMQILAQPENLGSNPSGPAKKQSHLLKNNCFQGFPLDANSNAGLFGSGASCENRKAAPPKTTSKDALFAMIPSSASALPIKRLVSLCSAKYKRVREVGFQKISRREKS